MGAIANALATVPVSTYYGGPTTTIFGKTPYFSELPEWCSWSGVGCNLNSYAITSLSIANPKPNHYGVRIPTALASLTNLQSINFNGLGLTGPIPNMPLLSRLTTLSLSDNMLTGSLPSFLALNAQHNALSVNVQKNCNLTAGNAYNSIGGVNLYGQGRCVGDAGTQFENRSQFGPCPLKFLSTRSCLFL